MRDGTETLRGNEIGRPVPHVGGQRPAVAEHHGLPGAPVLVEISMSWPLSWPTVTVGICVAFPVDRADRRCLAGTARAIRLVSAARRGFIGCGLPMPCRAGEIMGVVGTDVGNQRGRATAPLARHRPRAGRRSG